MNWKVDVLHVQVRWTAFLDLNIHYFGMCHTKWVIWQPSP